MFDGSDLTHWLTLYGLVTLVAVLLYVVTAHVLHQRRHPSAAIAWMLFIVLLPYVALPAFLSLGSRKLQRPRPPLAIASIPAAPRAGDEDRFFKRPFPSPRHPEHGTTGAEHSARRA